MTSQRAPKQWSLTSNETITSLEAWENNLKYILSLDSNFADFLTDGTSWGKKMNASPLRDFSNDNKSVPAPRRRTAAQKGNPFGNDARPNSKLCSYYFKKLL